MYIGVDLQRNKAFSDWHVYDDVVLQDYLDLAVTQILLVEIPPLAVLLLIIVLTKSI